MAQDVRFKRSLHELSVIASAISLNPAALRPLEYCSCNPTCQCEGETGCCQGKCPCHTDEAAFACSAETRSSRPWEAIVRNEVFREVVASFDETQVKTISDFVELADQISAKISGR